MDQGEMGAIPPSRRWTREDAERWLARDDGHDRWAEVDPEEVRTRAEAYARAMAGEEWIPIGAQVRFSVSPQGPQSRQWVWGRSSPPARLPLWRRVLAIVLGIRTGGR